MKKYFLLRGIMSVSGPIEKIGEIVCLLPDAQIRRVYLSDHYPLGKKKSSKIHREGPGNSGRYLIEVEGKDGEKLARDIASAVYGLYAVIDYPMEEEFELSEVPIGTKRMNIVYLDRLLDSKFGPGDHTMDMACHKERSQLLTGYGIPLHYVRLVFKFLPQVIADRELFDAVHLYAAGVWKVNFSPGDEADLCHDKKSEPRTRAEQVWLEESLLQCFRAIECLVGEPGNNIDRFRARLSAKGIDPDEPVGYDNETTFLKAISDLHDLRDATSGHGKRRRKQPLTYHETLCSQRLANGVIWRALESREGE